MQALAEMVPEMLASVEEDNDRASGFKWIIVFNIYSELWAEMTSINYLLTCIFLYVTEESFINMLFPLYRLELAWFVLSFILRGESFLLSINTEISFTINYLFFAGIHFDLYSKRLWFKREAPGRCSNLLLM